MSHSVQRVCGGPPVTTSFSASENATFDFGDTVEMRQLAKCCMQIQELAPAGDADSETSSRKTSGISHLRVGNLISQLTLLASSRLRLPVPRYFFQTLQETSVNLSVLPQPRVLGEPVSVPQGSQLALKVEGVLTHGKRASLFRSVAAICITISTTPPSKASSEKVRTSCQC
jgi:integrator complex subunit 7